MFRHALLKLMVPAALLLGAQSAFAENRLALVIGQSAYRSVPALPNPANDARAVTQMLTDSGFEVLDRRRSVARPDARDGQRIRRQGRGQGRRYRGAGVLCRPRPADRRREFSGAGRHRSEAGSRHSDPGGASQRHPEHADLGAEQDAHPAARCLPQQSVPGDRRPPAAGLRIVDAKIGAPGTFLSFSTSPGAVAEDGTGANSPYTTALLAAGKEQGIPIEETFKRVRLAVNKATEGRQTPWDSSSLTEDFSFSGTSVAGPKPAAAAEEDGRRVDARSEGQAGRGGERADRGRRHR